MKKQLSFFVAISLILMIPTVSTSMAQTQSPNDISGKYVNTAFGVEMVFPDGMHGYPGLSTNSTVAIAGSVVTDHFFGLSLHLWNNKTSGIDWSAPLPTCTNTEENTVSINGINYNSAVNICDSGVGLVLKTLIYHATINDLNYQFENGPYSSQSAYDNSINQFKDFMKTVKITVQNPSTNLPANQQTVSIPSWIKNNAGWWHDGSIGDDEFIKGIQYMITNGIMKIPSTQSSSGSSQEIPSWIKKNAGWWHDGQISDDEFVKGIQYMITNGIMKI
ncbi:MAG: hypothetical protein HY222_06165 [Thaumarchaeota archaeon]|nr:hypothetical protein [Nitrososphaerota archaeon]MBI3641961.1 hypothetical protein [Nitrososphaerota archaeon]